MNKNIRKMLQAVIWGLFVIIIGVLVILESMSIVSSIWAYIWPSALICLGISSMIPRGSKLFGLIMIVLGGFFLLKQLVPAFDISTGVGVAVVIILLGFYIIFTAFFSGNRSSNDDNSSEHSENKSTTENNKKINISFGAVENKITDNAFSGCEIECSFGSVQLDMRAIDPISDIYIKVNANFGGVEILLPKDVNLDLDKSAFVGGVSDKSIKTTDPSRPTVRISASCSFGGIEIK